MVPFADVLAHLESCGWELLRIAKPYRVFYRDGDLSSGLPILVEVHDGLVDSRDFEKIREVVDRIDRAGRGHGDSNG